MINAIVVCVIHPTDWSNLKVSPLQKSLPEHKLFLNTLLHAAHMKKTCEICQVAKILNESKRKNTRDLKTEQHENHAATSVCQKNFQLASNYVALNQCAL